MSFGSLVFTPLVKKLQERYGSRRRFIAWHERRGTGHDRYLTCPHERKASNEHDYHEGWNTNLLQGLGDRTARGV